MIKKSNFTRNYNFFENLVIMMFLIILIRCALGYLTTIFEKQNNMLLDLTVVLVLVKKIDLILELVNFLVIIVIVMLVIREIVLRKNNDSYRNLVNSIIGTFLFRKFITQRLQTPNIAQGNQITYEKNIVQIFNQSLRKSVLDITNQQLILQIKIPREAQAEKILNEHEIQIKEHIASMYPTYIISKFERIKYNLYLVGTKRN